MDDLFENDTERQYAWLDHLEELAEIHAKAKGLRERLSHERKVVLAELQIEAELSDPVRYKSVSAQEVYARSHAKYKEMLHKLEEATYRQEKSYRALQKRQWLFDAWRMELSFTRSQIPRYGNVT